MRINDLDYKDNKGNLEQEEVERQSEMLKPKGATDLESRTDNGSKTEEEKDTGLEGDNNLHTAKFDR